jgi:hypothetical protein
MIDPGWIASAQAMTPGLLLHLRLFLGWSSIVIGVLGTILPIIPGLPFLFIGAHLIGHRDPRLRWARVHTRLAMRHASRSRLPLVRTAGQWARRSNYEVVRYGRKWRAQRARVAGAAWAREEASDQTGETGQHTAESYVSRLRHATQDTLSILRPWGEAALRSTTQGIRCSKRGLQRIVRGWRKPPQQSQNNEESESC